MPPYYYYKNQKVELLQIENRFLVPYFNKTEYERIEKTVIGTDGFRLRKGISNTAFIANVEDRKISLDEISSDLNQSFEDFAKEDTKPIKVFAAFKSRGTIFGVNNEFVVRFKKLSDSKRENFNKMLETKKGIKLRKIKGLKNTFLYGVRITDPHEVIDFVNRLHRKAYIEYAHPDFLLNVKLSTVDPYFKEQWALQENGVTPSGKSASVSINIQPAWKKIVDNKIQLNSVGIMIIDKGIDKHADYEITLNDNPVGETSHGTLVAGIIGAISDNGKGIAGIEPALGNAPKFNLYGENFKNEISGLETKSEYHQAMDFIETTLLSKGKEPEGIKVINMSFNFPHHTYLESLDQAFTQLSSKYLIVNSSGNCYHINDTRLKYPSKNENVLSVGAVDYKGHWISLYNNNWGSCYGDGLDLCAPGIEIVTTSLSTEMYFRYFDGTSASAAFVTGVAALLFAIKPDLSPEEVKDILIVSADSNSVKVLDEYDDEITDTSERQLRLGNGLINADKALDELISRFPQIVPPEN